MKKGAASAKEVLPQTLTNRAHARAEWVGPPACSCLCGKEREGGREREQGEGEGRTGRKEARCSGAPLIFGLGWVSI